MILLFLMRNLSLNIVNKRLIFFISIAFALGILFSFEILSFNLIFWIFGALILIPIIIIGYKLNILKYIIILIFSFIFGIFLYSIAFNTYIKTPILDEEYQVQGKIENVYKNGNKNYVILSKTKFNDKAIEGNFFLSFTDNANSNFKKYDYIKFNSIVNSINLRNLGEINSLDYKNNIKFSGYTNNIEIVGTSKNFVDSIKLFVKQKLDSCMSNESSEIAFASLFGDKADMNSENKDSFKKSGLSHLLAVSGLHVGFVALIISWILNKIIKNKKIIYSVLIIMLLFYCFLCGFASSVVRAFIMLTIYFISKMFGRQNDGLTSLGLTLIIILLFKPLLVFDAGLQLSFLSVLFIFLYADKFSKKIRCLVKNKKVSDLLGTVIAVQLGVIPIIIKIYGEFSLLNIVTNIIGVPLFQLGYMMLFCILPLVCLLPFLSILLRLPDFIFYILNNFALKVSNVNFGNIKINYENKYLLILYILTFFIFSKFVMLDFNKKVSIVILNAILFICFFYCYSNISNLKNSQVSVFNVYGNYVYLLKDECDKIYVVDNDNLLINYREEFHDFLYYHKVKEIDFYVGRYATCIDEIKIKKFIDVSNQHEYSNIKIYDENYNKNISLNLNNQLFLFLSKNNTQSTLDNILINSEKKYDCLFSPSEISLPTMSNVTFSNNKNKMFNYLRSYQNFTLIFRNDKIYQLRRID